MRPPAPLAPGCVFPDAPGCALKPWASGSRHHSCSIHWAALAAGHSDPTGSGSSSRGVSGSIIKPWRGASAVEYVAQGRQQDPGPALCSVVSPAAGIGYFNSDPTTSERLALLPRHSRTED